MRCRSLASRIPVTAWGSGRHRGNEKGVLEEFWYNFTHNLFKPLLLFFYMGFLVPILKVPFEFPVQIYQGLTIFLLVAIGWEGGEKLAALGGTELRQALGFMIVGFVLNFFLGIIAYGVLRSVTKLRKIDAATVAGYYGSDSAGTYATCVGVLLGRQALSEVNKQHLCLRCLYACHAGGHGNPRLFGRAFFGFEASSTRDGRVGQPSLRSRL